MTEQSTQQSDPAVQLLGTRSQWKRLSQPVRELVGDAGRVRLTRVREAISADAGLPMPPIRVEPWGWVSPKGAGIFGRAIPLLVKSGGYQWGVQLPAATLLVFDDNTELRRVVCHEFAHCLWWDTRVISSAKEGRVDLADPTPAPEAGQDEYEWQEAKDERELVDPALWFGLWDTEHFLRREPGQESNDRLYELWIHPGLPVRTPKLHFELDGTIEVPDEIAERVDELAAHEQPRRTP